MPDWRPSGRHLYVPVSAFTCVTPPLPCVGAPAAAVLLPPVEPAAVPVPVAPAAVPPLVAPVVPVAPLLAVPFWLVLAAAFPDVLTPVSPPPCLFDGISTTS